MFVVTPAGFSALFSLNLVAANAEKLAFIQFFDENFPSPIVVSRDSEALRRSIYVVELKPFRATTPKTLAAKVIKATLTLLLYPCLVVLAAPFS